MSKVNKLVEELKHYNKLYREGGAVITDSAFDCLIEELKLLDPNNSYLNEIGHIVSDDRKETLPYIMASLNKIKTIDEFYKWIKNKNIPQNAEYIITPKYDGISLLNNERNGNSWTRGNGKVGQRSDKHYSYLSGYKKTKKNLFTIGEVIMRKDKFNAKFSKDYKNPRNLVAGAFNNKYPERNKELYENLDFIRYDIIDNNKYKFKYKSDILDKINLIQPSNEVVYEVITLKEFSEEFMLKLFNAWSLDYEIDGLVIEVNDISLQQQLGRETSTNNPCWARAYKGNFETVVETKVLDVVWQLSKSGLLKPVIQVEPIELDGVTISNVTGNNSKFIKSNLIGKGSVITIKRSGMVIPKVVDVIKHTDWELPTHFIDKDNNKKEMIPEFILWNDTDVELVYEFETDTQTLKQSLFFFKTLNCDNIGEGVLLQLFNSGYRTLKEILNITKPQLLNIEGFQQKKTNNVFDSIQTVKQGQPLSRLQHALGTFPNLGERKLRLLEHFTELPTINDIVSIDGFSTKSANVYLENYNKFFLEINNLNITFVRTKIIPSKQGKLTGVNIVFTGVRNKEIEQLLTDMGAIIQSGINNKTNYLLCKDVNGSSSKIKKAHNKGITVLNINDYKQITNGN